MAIVWKATRAEYMRALAEPDKFRVLVGDAVVATCDSEHEAKAVVAILSSMIAASSAALPEGK